MAVAIESGMPLLAVYDVPTAIAFYRDVLGFEVVRTSRPFDQGRDNYGWEHLQMNHINLMLNNMYEDNIRPERPDAERSKHHRDTTLYFMCRNVDGVSDSARKGNRSARAFEHPVRNATGAGIRPGRLFACLSVARGSEIVCSRRRMSASDGTWLRRTLKSN